MKTVHVFSFIMMLFFCATVFAQYPKDETIDPYPRKIKQRTLLKEFKCDTEGVAAWKALHDSKLIEQDGRIRIESTGHDPYVQLSGFSPFEAGVIELRIRMKNDMLSKAQFFWETQAKPGFIEDNSIHFAFVRDLKRTETYNMIFETDSPITRLRFDPGGSKGVCEVEFVQLYKIEYDETKKNPTPWFDSSWADKVENWETISSGAVEARFDKNGTGAQIFVDKQHIGDIYPLAYFNPDLPLGGSAGISIYKEETKINSVSHPDRFKPAQKTSDSSISFSSIEAHNTPERQLKFNIDENGIRFEGQSVDNAFFGPVFRPKGQMRQAILNGVEYLEKGEHSSSTADLETDEHLRFAPKALDITWPFMSVVTDKIGFGLLWDDPPQSQGVQAVFATPDFIFGDSNSHYMGLYGKRFSGSLKIKKNKNRTSSEQLTDLEELVLWAIRQYGLPDLPSRPRPDESQRLLNLAAFEKSIAFAPGEGWRHAAIPGATKQHFGANFGSDFVTAIWQLSGKLPEVPRLDNGGAHLRNPACFFLMNQSERFLEMVRSSSKRIAAQMHPDGSFPYDGIYLKGHWEGSASGHCGNSLFNLMYGYRILGDQTILETVKKGLDFANKYDVPRGAQVWELSLHTPDIMGSSRMCMANLWYYEATGEEKYLDAARRWAVTGLPFVYFWEQKQNSSRTEGLNDFVMRYATVPVLGATNWKAPNWIGLPVQWCGLDYGEALFLLAEHDKTLDWKKIAEGILIAGEQMQYVDGECIGLLPDSFVLETQERRPADINPTVLVMQRRRLQGKVESIDVVLSKDKKYRVVSPYKTTIETDAQGHSIAVIEGAAGTNYQILVNGAEVKTIKSNGTDRIELNTGK